MRVFCAFGTIIGLYLIAAGSRAEECGQRQTVARKLIAYGSMTVEGAWPWHGAMFKRQSTGTSYRCGVTILTQQFVITSAGCVLDPLLQKELIAVNELYVRTGMTNLYSTNHVQQSEVVNIIPHDEYDFKTSANNIALMKLFPYITYNAYVQPVCLRENNEVINQKLQSREGYIVGWGYNEEEKLQINMYEGVTKIWTEDECTRGTFDDVIMHHIPPKTFWVGSENSVFPGEGDSGGGLFVEVGNTWLLIGIAGNLFTGEPKCHTLFTSVLYYVEWINKIIDIPANYEIAAEPIDSIEKNNPTSASAERTQEYTAVQKCGQSQLIAQTLIFSGYTAQAGAWPWHGALFHRFRASQTSYACGVTVLTEQIVVTAAHCTFDQQEGQRRLPPERAYVQVGSTNLDSTDRNAQQHNVFRIIRHNEYDEEVFENDIALVKLYTEITYNKHVQPICLWKGDTSLEKLTSQLGYTVGWGYDQDYGLPKDLHEATMPIVTRKECIDSDPNYYRRYIFEHKTFCAGYRNGTTSAPGDSGSGLYLRQGDSWVLRGIVSNTKLNPNTLKIDPSSFVVLTDVSYYNEWIKFHVTNPEPIEIG